MKEKKRRWNRSFICVSVILIAAIKAFQSRLTIAPLLKSTRESSKIKPHDVPLLPLVNQEKNYTIQDQWKLDLLTRLQNISIKCKSLCTINNMDEYAKNAVVLDTPTSTKDQQDNLATSSIKKAYVTLQASVDCKSLFEMNELDAGDRTFPYPIPEEIVSLFTLNGTIPIQYRKRWQTAYVGGAAMENVWTKETIHEMLQSLNNSTMKGTYGVDVANELRDLIKSKMDISGKSVLIIGSERPWLEVIALHTGALKVTTLEYGRIVSQHPLIDTYTPDEFRRAYLNGSLPKFDAVLSYSSLEHSGLGRYGDALNPWGDILSLARAWCTTKEEGQLLLGLPTGKDHIRFNAHRCYGNIRWPLITINWEPIDGVVDFDKGRQTQGGTPHIFRKVAQK